MTALADALRAQAAVLLLLADAAEQLAPLPADELLPATAEATGIEARALLRAIADGRLPCARVGRKRYVRRSALVALAPAVVCKFPPESADASGDLARIAAEWRASRERRAARKARRDI